METRSTFWDVTASAVGFYGIGLAIIALIFFVWVELDNKISDNTKAITEIRVDMAGMRTEFAVGFADIVELMAGMKADLAGMKSELADLRTEVIRETHTNREGLIRLESRVWKLEGGSP